MFTFKVIFKGFVIYNGHSEKYFLLSLDESKKKIPWFGPDLDWTAKVVDLKLEP